MHIHKHTCMHAHILAIQHICICSSMYTCNALRYIEMHYMSSPYVTLRFKSHCIRKSYYMQRTARQDKAMGKRRGKTRTNKARQGIAMQGKTRQDQTRRTGQGMTRATRTDRNHPRQSKAGQGQTKQGRQRTWDRSGRGR